MADNPTGNNDAATLPTPIERRDITLPTTNVNVNETEPLVTGTSTTMRPNTGALTQAPQQPPQLSLQNPQPQIPNHVGRLARIGHVFNTLAGQQQNYSIDPQTGNTITTSVPRKPGQMFRDMLAGALMGGAAGYGHDFAGGIGAGGSAVIQDQRRQDLLRRQQAQEQFQNQLSANREQREARGFETSEQLKRAEIALHNIQVAEVAKNLESRDLHEHMEEAEFGRAKIAPMLAAGVVPTFKDIPDSEMHRLAADPKGPGWGLHWEITGYRTVQGEDGKRQYEPTYTSVDPNQKVAIDDGVIKMFRDSGMFKYDPGMEAHLKNIQKSGKAMDYDQYGALLNRAQALREKDIQDQNIQSEIDERQGRLKLIKSEMYNAGLEGQMKQLQLNDQKNLRKAIDLLDSPDVAGDFGKLAVKDRAAARQYYESSKAERDGLRQEYQLAQGAANKATDETERKELQTKADSAYAQLEQYDKLIGRMESSKDPGIKDVVNPDSSLAAGTATAQAAVLGKGRAWNKQDIDYYENFPTGALTDPVTRGIVAGLKAHPKWTEDQKAQFINISRGTWQTATNPRTGEQLITADGKSWKPVDESVAAASPPK